MGSDCPAVFLVVCGDLGDEQGSVQVAMRPCHLRQIGSGILAGTPSLSPWGGYWFPSLRAFKQCPLRSASCLSSQHLSFRLTFSACGLEFDADPFAYFTGGIAARPHVKHMNTRTAVKKQHTDKQAWELLSNLLSLTCQT